MPTIKNGNRNFPVAIEKGYLRFISPVYLTNLNQGEKYESFIVNVVVGSLRFARAEL